MIALAWHYFLGQGAFEWRSWTELQRSPADHWDPLTRTRWRRRTPGGRSAAAPRGPHRIRVRPPRLLQAPALMQPRSAYCVNRFRLLTLLNVNVNQPNNFLQIRT